MTKKYQAPQTDGGLFAVPSFQEYPQLILANRGVVGFQKDSLGFPLSDLRLRGRREILGESADLAKPVIMAGHQPELFHPGVWVKNFVLAGQAKKLQAHALNLIVDNDTFKHRSFHLPAISEHPELVELAKSEFDVSVPEVPYENAYPREFPTVETWFEQIQSATSRWPFEPMAKVVWPRIVHCLKNGASYTHAFVSVRQHYERQWGAGTPELPVSQLAETSSFAEFVHHLTLHARDFATEYNRAIVEFRRQNGIKSRNHPAPELAIDGLLTEVPFWVWNDDQPTRQRVFCRTVDDGVELLAGETPFVTLKTNDRPDEVRQRLKTSGWKLRPRALTLTMFSRLFLADLFIHGIGGGKYDEVTDAIIKRCFGITPPAYAVVSATIRLPLSRFPATPAKHLQQIRLLRDLAWNPQQFAEVQSSDPTLVAEKKALMTHEPSGHAERRQWYRQLSKITANLREKTADRRVQESSELTSINRQIEANRKILRRDFSWIFYPEETLSRAFRPFLD